MRLEATAVTVPMRGGHHAAHGTIADRELIHVTLQAGDGLTGHGEAAPLPSYDGVSGDDVRGALEACRPVLADYPGHAPVADVIARCGEVTVLPQALSAIDLALWDLAGRRISQPVWRLLAAGNARAGRLSIPVNWTIAAADRSGAALEAAQARAEGFGTVKVKVGLGDDAGRLAAVRAFAGPQMSIRIDANGAWDRAQAITTLGALEPTGIELCEEPVHGREAIAAVRDAVTIPLALDETAADPLALDAPAAADLVCLKLGRCAGISGTLAAAAHARAAGYEVFLASTLDGPLGIAAALHVAAVLRPARACGLATLAHFAERPNPLPARGGAIEVPSAPGLGPDTLVSWY